MVTVVRMTTLVGKAAPGTLVKINCRTAKKSQDFSLEKLLGSSLVFYTSKARSLSQTTNIISCCFPFYSTKHHQKNTINTFFSPFWSKKIIKHPKQIPKCPTLLDSFGFRGILAISGSEARTRRRFVAPQGRQISGMQFDNHQLMGVFLEKLRENGCFI